MINFTQGALRRRIEIDEAVKLDQAGILIRDDKRRRPFYFDGRFLTARDLTREQNYFLARQSELGRATGSGVITGLDVTFDNASFLTIQPGNGITSTGEMVTLLAPLRIDLADVAETQDLDTRFGIAATPKPSARNRSGVFVVALRPVEFTANPIAVYPQSLTGPRTIEDGDIVEAAAVTLIPYADESTPAERARQQARIARDVFSRRDALQPSQNALPLAMISVSRGVINWLDMFLVRREVGADHGDTLGFGFAPRALREAQFLQYRQYLAAILAQRRQANQTQPFAASDYFYLLPPTGPMPAAALDSNAFSQVFFPAGIQVELAVIPDDELRGVVEDALLLPPIDLTLRDQDQASTSVLILAPVTRREYQLVEAGVELGAQLQPAPLQVPKLFAGRKPLELLSSLTLRNQPLPVEIRQLTVDDRWRNALRRVQSKDSGNGAPLLWYVRRRNFAPKPELAGRAVRPGGDDVNRDAAFNATIAQLQPTLPAPPPVNLDLAKRWIALRIKAGVTPAALGVVQEALGQPKYTSKALAFLTALTMFEAVGPTEAPARKIAISLGDAKFGDGLQKLNAPPLNANLDTLTRALAGSRAVEFDQLLQTSDQTKVTVATTKLTPLVANPAQFAAQISTWVDAKAIS